MRNFGNINNAFSDVLLESFTKKDAKKKNKFKTYLKTIKESKLLKTQYLVYKNISDKYETNDLRVSEYIKESISLMDGFKLEDIIKANEKLVKLMGEKSKELEKDYDIKELHENIGTLIVIGRNKTPKNVDTIVESFDYVFNYVKNNKPTEDKKAISEAVGRLAIDKFNEKYSKLEEDEYKILKTIIESNDEGKKDVFKNTINECVDLIDNKLTESDIETKDKLLKVKDKILRMTYTEDTFINDVAKVIKLKKDLN